MEHVCKFELMALIDKAVVPLIKPDISNILEQQFGSNWFDVFARPIMMKYSDYHKLYISDDNPLDSFDLTALWFLMFPYEYVDGELYEPDGAGRYYQKYKGLSDEEMENLKDIRPLRNSLVHASARLRFVSPEHRKMFKTEETVVDSNGQKKVIRNLVFVGGTEMEGQRILHEDVFDFLSKTLLRLDPGIYNLINDARQRIMKEVMNPARYEQVSQASAADIAKQKRFATYLDIITSMRERYKFMKGYEWSTAPIGKPLDKFPWGDLFTADPNRWNLQYPSVVLQDTANRDIATAIQAKKDGDYDRAFYYFNHARSCGEMNANAYLAELYIERDDFDTAWEHINEGVRWKCPNACSLKGKMYHDGLGVDKDLRKAFEVIQAIYDETGNCSTEYYQWKYELQMEEALQLKEEGDRLLAQGNDEEAFKAYESSYAHGNKDIAFTLGLMCMNGRGTRENVLAAADYFKAAAHRGNTGAERILRTWYHDGIAVIRNLELAVIYAKKVYSKNPDKLDDRDIYIGYMMELTSQEITAKQQTGAGRQIDGPYIAYRLRRMTDVPKDVVIDWLKREATYGNISAMLDLSDLYEYGIAGQINKDAALEWLRKASERKPDDAFLSRLYKDRKRILAQLM